MKTHSSRFDGLVARYYPAVYSFAARLTDDPRDAVALTRQAFNEARKQLQRMRSQPAIATVKPTRLVCPVTAWTANAVTSKFCKNCGYALAEAEGRRGEPFHPGLFTECGNGFGVGIAGGQGLVDEHPLAGLEYGRDLGQMRPAVHALQKDDVHLRQQLLDAADQLDAPPGLELVRFLGDGHADQAADGEVTGVHVELFRRSKREAAVFSGGIGQLGNQDIGGRVNLEDGRDEQLGIRLVGVDVISASDTKRQLDRGGFSHHDLHRRDRRRGNAVRGARLWLLDLRKG